MLPVVGGGRQSGGSFDATRRDKWYSYEACDVVIFLPIVISLSLCPCLQSTVENCALEVGDVPF